MNKNLIPGAAWPFCVTLMIVILLFGSNPAGAQKSGNISYDQASQIYPAVKIITDRSWYSAGDKIWFSAWSYNPVTQRAVDTSLMLRLGIYNDKGEEIFFGRYPLKSGKSYGDIRLPINLPTAFYRIITGFSDRFPGKRNLDVLEFPLINIRKPPEPFVSFKEKKSAAPPETVSVKKMQNNSALNYDILLQKKVLQPGENSNLQINTIETNNSFFCLMISSDIGISDPVNRYRLISSSGSLEDDDNKAPGNSVSLEVTTAYQNSNKVLLMNIPGNTSWFETHWFSKDFTKIIDLPDEEGSFPLVLQVLEKGENVEFGATIRNGDVKWEIPENPRNEKELKILHEIMTKAGQKEEFISSYELMGYDPVPSFLPVKDTASPEPAFYSPADKVYLISDYPVTGTMEEFIKQYVNSVKVKKRKGKAGIILRMLYRDEPDQNPNMSVLVNGVPVNRIDELLETHPSKVERIELSFKKLIYKEYLFPGIVSIFTTEPALTKRYLPATVEIAEIKAYTPRQTSFSCNQEFQTGNENLPDLRYLLFWNPEMRKFCPAGKTIYFTAPEYSGSYVVRLCGYDNSGDWVEKTETIKVK